MEQKIKTSENFSIVWAVLILPSLLFALVMFLRNDMVLADDFAKSLMKIADKLLIGTPLIIVLTIISSYVLRKKNCIIFSIIIQFAPIITIMLGFAIDHIASNYAIFNALH